MFEMLAGKGEYHETAQQLNFDPPVYAQVNDQVKLRKPGINYLLQRGRRRIFLELGRVQIELFQNFVARLLQTGSKFMVDTEAVFHKMDKV